VDPRCRRSLTKPRLGDHCIVQLAEDLLERRDRLGKPHRILSRRRGGRLRCIAAPLCPDAQIVELLVRDVLTASRERTRLQRAPGLADQARQCFTSGRRRCFCQDRRLGSRDQVVDHLEVAVGVDRDQQMTSCRAHLAGQRAHDRECRATVRFGERGGGSPETIAEDLGVADSAQLAAEPAEVVPQPFRPGLVEQGTERAQVAAQAASCDARLVHILNVDAEADACIVPEKADDRCAQSPPHDIPGGRSASKRHRTDLGRGRADQPERTRHQGARTRLLRTGSLIPGGDLIEQGAALAEEVDLTEALRNARTRVDRDGVVDETGEDSALRIQKGGLGGYGDQPSDELDGARRA
jgi:hypothetical protein